ncbi:helix-hairpin-helix domain-containing protein [Bacillus sp. NPDC077027]|uniref:helix-hairpin-helix domain-containing protein n=1 Tax=Bacillus sp. NPDC077027 TaxID=3390548 RepID=UPI003D07ACD9
MERLVQLKKHIPYIVSGVILFISISLFIWSKQGTNKNEQSGEERIELVESQENKVEQTDDEQMTIVVEVKGAVKRPGVYALQSEDRIQQAIKEAGGYTENANDKEINQAARLEDSMMIYVPKKGEEATGQPTAGLTSSEHHVDEFINVNTADASALQKVNGIGPAKAEAILAYREEHGAFQKIEDLRNIPGFGEKTVERLKNHLTVK